MKVKELIKKLADLDGDKEMFIYTDWDYLHEDWTFFKQVYDVEDFEFSRWYFLKPEGDKPLVEELVWWYRYSKKIYERGMILRYHWGGRMLLYRVN